MTVILVFHMSDDFPFFYGKYHSLEAAQARAQHLTNLSRSQTGLPALELEWTPEEEDSPLFDAIHGERPANLWRAPYEGHAHMIISYAMLQ